MADFETVTRIIRIFLYLNQRYLDIGYYNKMKVETRVGTGGWTICKEEFSIEGTVSPYVMKCENSMIARQLRISTSVLAGVRINEVKVFGFEVKGKYGK